jgi:hypothetical protein
LEVYPALVQNYTVYRAFGLERGKIIKILQYCKDVGLFPFHNDEPRITNLYRVSVSLSEHTPDFVMHFENSGDVFRMERGFFPLIAMGLYYAGRMKDPEVNAGKIEHGTAETPNHDCPFIVFDVPATDWAGELLQ